MTTTATSDAVVCAQSGSAPFDSRRRTANRIFRGALAFNIALTLFWVVLVATGSETIFFRGYEASAEAFRRVAFGVLWVVLSHGLPPAWIVLAVIIAIANTLLELFSPRGTDDFTMATAGALICWAFGALIG
jgi:hypothetical protein